MEKEYRLILVCVDEDERAADVISRASEMASDGKTKVRIISTIETEAGEAMTYHMMEDVMDAPYGGMVETAWMREQLASRKQYLTELVAQNVRSEHVLIAYDVRFGAATTVILKQCDDFQGVLIVVGATSKKTLKRLLVGSVAQYLVNHAPCDVLVVK